MNPLNASQVHILQVLAKHPEGLTRQEMQAVLPPGVSLSADNLGPVTDDPLDRGSNPDSLRAREMVTVQTFEDEPATYRITPEGKRWATKSAARSKMPDDQRIPPAVLDAAVNQVRSNKSYGLELYTPDDINEVRSYCAMYDAERGVDASIEHYSAITDENIILQMCNRRKQGAYSDPSAKRRTSLVKLGVLLREFNLSLDEDSRAEYEELCDNHDIDLED